MAVIWKYKPINTEKESSLVKDILNTIAGGFLLFGILAVPMVLNSTLYGQCQQMQNFSKNNIEHTLKDPIIKLNNFLYHK